MMVICTKKLRCSCHPRALRLGGLTAEHNYMYVAHILQYLPLLEVKITFVLTHLLDILVGLPFLLGLLGIAT